MKIRAVLVSVVVLGGLFNAPIADIQTGLIGYWKFDEGTGTTTADVSGNNQNGKVEGATWSTQGKFGGCLEFGNNKLVRVANSPILNTMPNGLTLAAWVNRTANSAWNMIVSRGVDTGTSEYYGLEVVGDKAGLSLDPDNGPYQRINGPTVPVGQWVYLVGTYDKTSLKLYFNGELVATGANNKSFNFKDQNPLILGGNINNSTRLVDMFNGRLDEMRIYNRGLSAAEVTELYHDEGSVMIRDPLISFNRSPGFTAPNFFNSYNSRGQKVAGTPLKRCSILNFRPIQIDR